jgi:hypothetical protein
MHCVGGSQVPSMGLSQFRGGAKHGKQLMDHLKKVKGEEYAKEFMEGMGNVCKKASTVAPAPEEDNTIHASTGIPMRVLRNMPLSQLYAINEMQLDREMRNARADELRERIARRRRNVPDTARTITSEAIEEMDGMGNEPSRIAPAPVEKKKLRKYKSASSEEDEVMKVEEKEPVSKKRVAKKKQTEAKAEEQHPFGVEEMDGGKKPKKWIQKVVADMKKGAFTKQALRHKMTPDEFAKEVMAHPDKYTLTTRRRANFLINIEKSKHGKGMSGGFGTGAYEGQGKMDKRKARGAMISKLMKEKGMSLAEASKYIKQHGSV